MNLFQIKIYALNVSFYNPKAVEQNPDIPILGVCLGHQMLAQINGIDVKRARTPMHGQVSYIEYYDNGSCTTRDGCQLFKNLPQLFRAVRYHSLIVPNFEKSETLDILARYEKFFHKSIFPFKPLKFHFFPF